MFAFKDLLLRDFLLASLSVRISRILSSPVSVSAMDSDVGLVALWGP